jgi:DNA-binding transcriptional ArsR family regulator
MAKYEPDLSLIFQALSDPTRRSMVARLAGGAQTVSILAKPTGMALPTVMRHLSVLEEAGLVTSVKDGRTRTVTLVPEALMPVRTWLDEQRDIWEGRLDRLEDYVLNMMKDPSNDA